MLHSNLGVIIQSSKTILSVKGANIGGFLKVASAMREQGLV